jgi:hypothetical protein
MAPSNLRQFRHLEWGFRTQWRGFIFTTKTISYSNTLIGSRVACGSTSRFPTRGPTITEKMVAKKQYAVGPRAHTHVDRL